MSIITKIKTIFKKELASVLAPLEKIHSNLDKFLDQAALDIQENTKKVTELLSKNDSHRIEQNTALKVKENIANLLGKL